MELRKDPVTQSWMLISDEDEQAMPETGPCRFCAGDDPGLGRPIYVAPGGGVTVYPHPHPLFRIEGREARAAEGIYDRMRTVGAHEVIVENRDHDSLWQQASEQEIGVVLKTYAVRIADLKKDVRFRYVTVFRNRGQLAGALFTHPHSELTATPFIPRRMVYELRSAQRYFQDKERCVFCDIVQQEESGGTRVVEVTPNYIAICPFASRVPYESWVLPRYHAASFEQDVTSRADPFELAGLLRRSVARVDGVAEAFHLVLHTTPNTSTQRGLTPQWTTIADDYHWHFEILPIAEKRTRSYSIKEVYYSPVSPEHAAAVLRGKG